jgi:DNA-binding transcriptional MocR family regulator
MPRKRTLANEQQQQDETVTREPGEDPSEHVVEPNPRGWAHNNAAGVEFLTRRDPYEALIRFKEKPPQEVIDTMKDNGFRWNRDSQAWARPIGYNSAAQDRELGRRTYGKVVEMLLEQKGIEAGQMQDEGITF